MATGSIDLNDMPFIAIFSVAAAAGLGMFVIPPSVTGLDGVVFILEEGPGKLATFLTTIASVLFQSCSEQFNMDRALTLATVDIAVASIHRDSAPSAYYLDKYADSAGSE